MDSIGIGDVFIGTDEFGTVNVKDIFISPTTKNVVYEVVNRDDEAMAFYCNAASLIPEPVNWTRKDKP